MVVFSTNDSTISSSSSWKSSSAGWSARAGFTATVVAYPFDGVGSVVVMGGTNDTQALNEVWIFTGRDNNAYAPLLASPPWTPRFGHQATTDLAGLTLILAGGRAMDGTLNNEVWSCTFSTLNGITLYWHRLTNTPSFTARTLVSLFNIQDLFYLYGGAQTAGSMDDSQRADQQHAGR